MANNESNEEPKENEEPANEELPEGLTAEQAAEARPYDEVETWRKSKNTLFGILGAIALGVAISSYLQKSEDEEAAERSLRFLRANLEEVTAEEGFLSFAEDYDDALGGVAQYRAASIQYDEGRYAEAVGNFKTAAIRLKGDPLEGRALIGAAVSMLESEQVDAGKSALAAVAENSNLLPTDRREARFLLGVQALAEENTDAFDSQRSELGKDENASAQIARLEELKKLQALLKQAKSLPEINLAKGADYLSKQRKRKPVKETESGLLYEVLKKGSGQKPSADDEVEVHYHGTLTDGQVFDSSKDRGEPAKFRVNQVISGWTEALQLMNTGAKWKLYIPADLAYGESGNNAIGPNEVLTFEVELLSITPPVVEPELPDLNESEPIPAIFPDEENASDANASK
jgi:FKBP-type peptidyl-prolyl cis-trans isomerase FklB